MLPPPTHADHETCSLLDGEQHVVRDAPEAGRHKELAAARSTSARLTLDVPLSRLMEPGGGCLSLHQGFSIFCA